MGSRMMDPVRKIYIGGLPNNANKYDIEDAVGKIGRVTEVNNITRIIINITIILSSSLSFSHDQQKCIIIIRCGSLRDPQALHSWRWRRRGMRRTRAGSSMAPGSAATGSRWGSLDTCRWLPPRPLVIFSSCYLQNITSSLSEEV